MYAQMDFDPAEVTENELFGVDFVYDLSRLSPSEQLLSVTAMTLAVVSGGVDASPSSHLIGPAYVAINPFNKTGLTTMAVQRIQGLLPGIVYSLQADVLTTNANTLSLWSRIPPENAPNVWQPRNLRP